MTEAELQLCELVDEVLAALRWSQVLGWGNQYLLNQRLDVTQEERDRVMRAAAKTVDEDGQLQDWQRRLDDLKARLARIDAHMRSDAPATSGAEPARGSEPPPPAEAEHGA
ncbi:MAG: hypothetical protein VYE77_12510 [Planctomycetota bacterium]|nr:hypothetical protein [Planctomycetota bacterium]